MIGPMGDPAPGLKGISRGFPAVWLSAVRDAVECHVKIKPASRIPSTAFIPPSISLERPNTKVAKHDNVNQGFCIHRIDGPQPGKRNPEKRK